ncbi:carboxymuconolactone decarboxylase family protein [Streptomyces tendae]|uniref:carboxymuconolactone decarboxylase family protein n=1 Tax=Streptomyces tendae TaxID=1932 RepID=UPI0033C30F99
MIRSSQVNGCAYCLRMHTHATRSGGARPPTGPSYSSYGRDQVHRQSADQPVATFMRRVHAEASRPQNNRGHRERVAGPADDRLNTHLACDAVHEFITIAESELRGSDPGWSGQSEAGTVTGCIT